MRHRRHLRHCLSLLGFAVPTYLATAQTTADSTRVSYTEEVLARPVIDDTTALQVQREDRDLWKLGLNNIVLRGTNESGYNRVGVHLIYERKVYRPAWSVLAEVSPSVASRYGFDMRMQLAGRYYYNLERRIRQGRGAGNFSANYFSLAVGCGPGYYSETPFYRFTQSGKLLHVDAALLYGLQRRLGRRWFVDANLGVTRLFTTRQQRIVQLGGSLRIGLALGNAPVTRTYLPSDEAEYSAAPRMYVGAEAGMYSFSLLGTYYGEYRGASQLSLAIPSLYVGRYISPRLAVQVGGHYQHSAREYSNSYIAYDAVTKNDFYYTSLSVLLRYSLTRSSFQRVQFEATGGGAIGIGHGRSQEKNLLNGEVLNTYRYNTIGVGPIVGLNAVYGFGQDRRIQATAGYRMSILVNNDYSPFSPNGSISFGLRYRFLYMK